MSPFQKITRSIACAGALLWAALLPADSARISGVVTDTARRPIANAEVIAVPDQPRYYLPADLQPLASTSTNDRGEFSLDVPTTGPTALIGWGKTHRMTKFPLDPQTAGSRTIGLALAEAFALTGQVTDADTGAPIAHATIGPLAPGLDTQTQRGLRVVPQWAQTDEQGRFSLHGIAKDIDHTFLVSAPGYMMSNVDLPPDRTEITIPLNKGGFDISGQVYARNQADRAFANTLIWANGNGFNVYSRTNANGQFQITGLPGGTFSVEPLFSGDRTAAVAVVEMPRDHHTSISLEVSSGYYVRGITIDEETSTPAAGVPVSLLDLWTTSTADGTFRLGPFYQAQPLTPVVSEEAGWRLASFTSNSEYDVAEGFEDIDNLELKVRRRRIIDVSISNSAITTAPIAVALLDAIGAAQRVEATSATASLAVFSAGRYHLYANSGGLASAVIPLDVNEETTIPVSLDLAPAAHIAGQITVTNTDETTRVQSLRLAMYTFAQQEKGPALSLYTQPRPDGTFAMASMPTGSFLLSLSNQAGTHQTTHPVTVTPGLNTLDPLTWQAGHNISGKITAPDDQPVPFARVTLLPTAGQPLQIQAREDGTFEFQDVYADSIASLIVEAANFAIYTRQDISLPTSEMAIQLQKLGRLSITIDAPATTRWDLQIVRMSRFGMGAYAEQLMGNSVFQREVNGGETLETALPESGQFRIVANTTNHSEMRVSEAFSWAGESASGTAMTLQRQSPGRISGTISGTDETVLVTLSNTAVPERGEVEPLETTVHSENGRFQADGLVPGNYLIAAQGDTYTAYQLNLEVSPGQTATASLEAAAASDLEGSVILNGQPLEGATVTVLSETDSSFPPQTTTTDADGHFHISGLLPDIYQVAASYEAEEGALSTRLSLKIDPASPAPPLRLNLSRPKTVQFVIPPGSPIQPGSDVSFMHKQTRQLTPAQWTQAGLQANLSVGEYEVWQGENVAAHATVNEDGTGVIK